jgi:hypothetical protein
MSIATRSDMTNAARRQAEIAAREAAEAERSGRLDEAALLRSREESIRRAIRLLGGWERQSRAAEAR